MLEDLTNTLDSGSTMWRTLDLRDLHLVRFAQRELWDEADMLRLAREARQPRGSVIRKFARKLTRRRAA